MEIAFVPNPNKQIVIGYFAIHFFADGYIPFVIAQGFYSTSGENKEIIGRTWLTEKFTELRGRI